MPSVHTYDFHSLSCLVLSSTKSIFPYSLPLAGFRICEAARHGTSVRHDATIHLSIHPPHHPHHEHFHKNMFHTFLNICFLYTHSYEWQDRWLAGWAKRVTGTRRMDDKFKMENCWFFSSYSELGAFAVLSRDTLSSLQPEYDDWLSHVPLQKVNGGTARWVPVGGSGTSFSSSSLEIPHSPTLFIFPAFQSFLQ